MEDQLPDSPAVDVACNGVVDGGGGGGDLNERDEEMRRDE